MALKTEKGYDVPTLTFFGDPIPLEDQERLKVCLDTGNFGLFTAISGISTTPCNQCTIARNPHIDRNIVPEVDHKLREAEDSGNEKELFALRKRYLRFGATGQNSP